MAKIVRNAGIEICNGLAEAGPAWSGRFSASWDIVPLGSAPRDRNVVELSAVYEYSYRNFPLRIFENALFKNITTFNIVNTAPYAAAALDIEEGNFTRGGKGFPIKPIIKEGFRPYDFAAGEQVEHFRWQLDSGPRYDKSGDPIEPNAGITAPKDWFDTYKAGGALQRDLGRGVNIRLSSGLQ